jgi:hypothetical protein
LQRIFHNFHSFGDDTTFTANIRQENCGLSLNPGLRLCLKTRSGFERFVVRLTGSPPEADINDKTNIACFSSLGVARDRLCQAKNRSISHPTMEFSRRA